MNVSIAICTWNRSNLLADTLQRMTDLIVPAELCWELIVVNNNCTDDTDQVLERFARHLPLRRIFEERPGQSHARNAAVAAAKGDLIVWTDDDVRVDEHWLAAYATAAQRWPEASFFGGPIVPWFETTPPAWITENLELLRGMLVLHDIQAEERLFEKPGEFPFGANMAFRRTAFQDVQFDPNLGRVKDTTLLCDESALFDVLARRGHRGAWVPAARVQHFTSRQRMRRQYVWEYYAGYARSLARVQGSSELHVPAWQYRRCAEYLLKAHTQRLLRRNDWVVWMKKAALDWGSIVETRARRKRTATTQPASCTP